MSHAQRLVLVVGLLGLGFVVALASVGLAHMPIASATVGDCHMGTLATPDQYSKYSADYYLPGVPRTGQPYNFTLAVYGPAHVPAGQIPTVENTVMLDNKYQPVVDPNNGNPITWDVTFDGCEQDGRLSHMYRFSGHWAGAPQAGPYVLAVRFRFPPSNTGNGVTVDFFVNLQVFDAATTLAATHWETRLDGLPDQNPDNNAYNLDTAAERATASTTFYFRGNPNYDGKSVIDGGMVSSVPQANSDSPFVLNGNVYVSTGSFPYDQQQGGGRQNGTITVQPYSGPPVGGQPYSWEARVIEPLQVRNGQDYHLKVGSYVVDNSFTGNVAGGRSATNIGEGGGFTFYANPGKPTVPRNADPANATISWAPVNPSTWDAQTTRLTYSFVACPPDAQSRQDCIIKSGLTAPTYTASLNPGVPYNASVMAVFAQGAPNDPNPVLIDSEARQNTIEVDGVGPSSATPTPTRPPMTDTPTPPLPTDTPTPAPPTDTPTPAIATGLLAQTAVPYAWVRAVHAEDTSATDGLYASTWGTPTPTGTQGPAQAQEYATFYWQLGRPLHILPALGEHTLDNRLILHDQGSDATAILVPRLVTSMHYTVEDGGAVDGYHCGPPPGATNPYSHDRHYPGEVDPFGQRVSLVWAPATLDGTLPPTTLRCDPAVLSRPGPKPIALRYIVEQHLVYDARFLAAPPANLVGSTISCTSQLQSLPPAAPAVPSTADASDAAVPPPAPAFATPGPAPAAPCPGGGVGQAAVRDALANWGTQLRLGDAGGRITAAAESESGGVTEIRLTVERTIDLHYHLVVATNVAP